MLKIIITLLAVSLGAATIPGHAAEPAAAKPAATKSAKRLDSLGGGRACDHEGKGQAKSGCCGGMKQAQGGMSGCCGGMKQARAGMGGCCGGMGQSKAGMGERGCCKMGAGEADLHDHAPAMGHDEMAERVRLLEERVEALQKMLAQQPAKS